MGGGVKRLRSEPKSRAKLHEERMARFQNRSESEIRSNLDDGSGKKRYVKGGNSDAEVIPAFQIAALIKEFCRRWLADRPFVGEGPRTTRENTFMGPMDYIAYHAGYSTRNLSRIVNGGVEVVNFTLAEKILIAIDKEHLLRTDEIQVVPNPSWSPEWWIAWKEEQRACYGDE